MGNFGTNLFTQTDFDGDAVLAPKNVGTLGKHMFSEHVSNVPAECNILAARAVYREL